MPEKSENKDFKNEMKWETQFKKFELDEYFYFYAHGTAK